MILIILSLDLQNLRLRRATLTNHHRFKIVTLLFKENPKLFRLMRAFPFSLERKMKVLFSSLLDTNIYSKWCDDRPPPSAPSTPSWVMRGCVIFTKIVKSLKISPA